ncbi:hypothetical protein V8G54_024373 [Vigna mungo]|uniref:DNA replication factor RFC1 C-terminal domain-containing protein n=1 Tax=Vigna mungo TaxID=3915 RepID=A0AAQ3N667_VIGMU
MAKRLMDVAKSEGLQVNEIALEELAERVNGDMRMAVNQLQYMSLSMSIINYDDIRQRFLTNAKDEDISPFTAVDKLFGFNAGKLKMDERINLSMSDPDLVPLLIQDDNGIKRMNLIARAAESIADGDIVNVQIRRYRQWQLSQASCTATCIIPASLLHGQREILEQYVNTILLPSLFWAQGENIVINGTFSVWLKSLQQTKLTYGPLKTGARVPSFYATRVTEAPISSETHLSLQNQLSKSSQSVVDLVDYELQSIVDLVDYDHATNPFWRDELVDLFRLSLFMVGFCGSLFILVFSLNSSDFASRSGERNFNRFGGWLGKNSTMGKNFRLLDDLHVHILASRESSSGRDTIRMEYLTLILKRLTEPLRTLPKAEAVQQVVEFMNTYSISQEDFDTIVELSKFKGQPNPLDGIQPAVKSALTKAYKEQSKSRVVRVADQITLPGVKKAPKKRIAAILEPAEEGGKNEDDTLDESEEENTSDTEELEGITKGEKLQSELQSLNSKATQVQLELKGTGNSSSKKASAGRGKGASASGKKNHALRVVDVQAS